MYPYKLNEHYGDKNQKSYQNRTIVFILVWKLFNFKRVELRDKINVIEHNKVITRKVMFHLSLWKNLQVSKLYIILGAIF